MKFKILALFHLNLSNWHPAMRTYIIHSEIYYSINVTINSFYFDEIYRNVYFDVWSWISICISSIFIYE